MDKFKIGDVFSFNEGDLSIYHLLFLENIDLVSRYPIKLKAINTLKNEIDIVELNYDSFSLIDFLHKNTLFYEGNVFNTMNGLPLNICICPIFELMNLGCKCGGK